MPPLTVIAMPWFAPALPVGIVIVDADEGCKLTRVTIMPFVKVAAVALVLLVGVRIQVDSVAVGFKKITRPDPVMVIVDDAADKSCEMVVEEAGPPLI